jgi:hypothetical protein
VNIIKILQAVFAAALLFGISACGQTPASRFYTLTAQAEVNAESAANKTNKLIIGIAPIEVAPYLERPEIVTRSSPTQIELAAFDRWAGPFENIVAESLADNISRLLPSVHTIISPWPEADYEYQLVVKIKKFESDENGFIKLSSSWGILQKKTRKMVGTYESTIIQPGTSSDYDSITRNMSLALVQLSEEIAAELQQVLADRM